MLVLTRRFGERIVVPDLDLTVTVLGIEGNRVRLGISAPDRVEVYREEIWHRIHRPSPDGEENRSGSR
jgi:carbon storage regulator